MVEYFEEVQIKLKVAQMTISYSEFLKQNDGEEHGNLVEFNILKKICYNTLVAKILY